MDRFDDVRRLSRAPMDALSVPPIEDLVTLTFNEGTLWKDPELTKMLLEYGKHPQLGVEELHKAGLTGKGVNVAIIDHPLAVDHPEYAGKILRYRNFCGEDRAGSMHGPAVTSLLVGSSLGVAPEARVVYAAVPTWESDAKFGVDALEWVMQVNQGLPDGKKIKFISVSAAFGDKSIFSKNTELWNKKVQEVQESGVCVVECTEGNRFVSSGYIDYATREFKYGFPDMQMRRKQVGQVHVPNSLRTVAESFDNQHFSYAYWGSAGLSWGIPYASGVLCLGQQANPDLSADELKRLLIETAQENECIISPAEFVKRARQAKPDSSFNQSPADRKGK